VFFSDTKEIAMRPRWVVLKRTKKVPTSFSTNIASESVREAKPKISGGDSHTHSRARSRMLFNTGTHLQRSNHPLLTSSEIRFVREGNSPLAKGLEVLEPDQEAIWLKDLHVAQAHRWGKEELDNQNLHQPLILPHHIMGKTYQL